jgi:hypothetical protein
MKDNYLKRYINKFLNDIQNHDKEYFQIIKNKIKDYNRKEIISKILITIKELSFFGQITKRNIYPLCQCILYGIVNNCLTVFSMNSNALTKDINKLREKPQYAQINFINTKLEQIEKKINIPINYISILPDYSNEYPFEIYENTWAKNKEYLENVSNKKAYRLSELFQRNIEKFKKKIYATININELNKIIKYYENNKFIILSFSADSNFQRNQILNYLVSGVILEKVLPFSILLDIQKKYYSFEQKFYNYARKYKLPIILCGQKY